MCGMVATTEVYRSRIASSVHTEYDSNDKHAGQRISDELIIPSLILYFGPNPFSEMSTIPSGIDMSNYTALAALLHGGHIKPTAPTETMPPPLPPARNISDNSMNYQNQRPFAQDTYRRFETDPNPTSFDSHWGNSEAPWSPLPFSSLD